MKARRAKIHRRTAETEIELELVVDGTGQHAINTLVPFLDHMLAHVAVHGLLDLTVRARGDIEVDDHHTVEDVGIVLGQALREALGDKAGLRRYGSVVLPMDEALALVAVDCSGRGLLAYDVTFPRQKIGAFDTELIEEFLRALAANGGLTLHVRLLAGRNAHHMAEALFKALGRALRMALERDPRCEGVPSTKGMLT
ncbi:MAG: imidazoleglycerol-phosphate dehydratase HisB [Anaerolineae bacterium]